MTPLVSVVIPSFNRPLFLKRRSIPSVLRQSYSNWEVIVVGDGPEDDSLRQAVESFHDGRIRYTEIQRPDYSGYSRQQLWHGAGAAARNYGVQQSQGEIIAPLDDDDEFLPNHLADCVSALGHGAADFVYGFVFVRDPETGENSREDWLSWSDPGTRDLFLQRNIIFVPSVAYVREYAHVLYPTDGEAPADYACWLAMHAKGARFTSVDRPQAVYYGDNLTSRIRVSVPALPPIQEVEQMLNKSREGNGSPGWRLATQLKREIGELLGVPGVICVADCGDALKIAFQALRATRCKDRSEVIVPSYAHPRLVDAALLSGFEPIFCDIDPDTLCLSAEAVQHRLNRNTAVIAAFHAHGNPCDMETLDRLARTSGAVLLGDGGEAFGASIAGRPIGVWGDIAVLCLTDNCAFTAIRDRQVLEWIECRQQDGIGITSQSLCEYSAAAALCSLTHANSWLARRCEALDRYQQRLATPCFRFQRPAVADAIRSCQEAVLIFKSTGEAQHVRRRLQAYRIESLPGLEPLHQLPNYKSIRRGPLNSTEQLAGCTLGIPLYSTIRNDVIDLVVEAVQEALA